MAKFGSGSESYVINFSPPTRPESALEKNGPAKGGRLAAPAHPPAVRIVICPVISETLSQALAQSSVGWEGLLEPGSEKDRISHCSLLLLGKPRNGFNANIQFVQPKPRLF